MNTLLQKSRLLFIICTILFGSFQFGNAQVTTDKGGGKGGEGIEQGAKNLPFSIFRPSFVYLEDCYNNVKHIYLDLDVDPSFKTSVNFEKIDYLQIRPKWSKGDGTPITVKKMDNGFELDIYDQNFEGDRIEFDLEAFTGKGKSILKETHAPLAIKEDGFVDVAVHLDDKLAEFQTTKNTSLAQFMCGKSVSRIQLLAFFRDYLELSTEEMCEMIAKYNLLQLGKLNQQISYIWEYNLCKELEAFLDGNINPNDNGGCNCNLIRTNRTALNVGTSSTPSSDQEQCTDYDAKLKTGDYEFGSNDDNLIVNEGIMGAARGFAFVMQYDGGEDSPEVFEYETMLGWSQLTFRSVCVDPVTITPNLENCSACVKDIELQYGYYTHGYSYGEKKWHANGSKLGMKAEEWALLAIQQNDEGTIADQGGATYQIDCDAPGNTLEETLTEASGVIDAVSTVLSGVSVDNVIAATTAIVSFVEDNILAQFCEQLYDNNETLMTGTEQFTLEPNGYFKAVITGGVNLAGECHNNGIGFINLNSDFYMAAVVTTQAPDGGEIPEYCECEKIGGYVLGSMDQYTPLPEPLSDNQQLFDMTSVFERTPLGDFTIRQLAGDYLGSHGPWAPKWDQQGCCSAVNLECQSECAYLAGCDFTGNGGSYIKSDDLFGSSQALLSEGVDQDITMYPNPLSRGESLDIAIADPTLVSGIQIMDLQGAMVQNINVDGNANIYLNSNSFQSGLYIVVVNYVDGSRGLKKFSIVE